MKANTVISSFLLLIAFSCSATDISQADKEKMISLMQDAAPYAAGMGKSGDDVCREMSNDMVIKYGNQLSKLGETPSHIRDSSYGICISAISSAESSRSENELDMWKTSALANVDRQLQGDTRNPSPKQFLIESINNSVKIARPFYFMKELSIKYSSR